MELEEPASSAAQALSIDKRHVYHVVRDSLAGVNGAAAKMLLGRMACTVRQRYCLTCTTFRASVRYYQSEDAGLRRQPFSNAVRVR